MAKVTRQLNGYYWVHAGRFEHTCSEKHVQDAVEYVDDLEIAQALEDIADDEPKPSFPKSDIAEAAKWLQNMDAGVISRKTAMSELGIDVDEEMRKMADEASKVRYAHRH